jgi:hypothetical protein
MKLTDQPTHRLTFTGGRTAAVTLFCDLGDFHTEEADGPIGPYSWLFTDYDDPDDPDPFWVTPMKAALNDPTFLSLTRL